MIIYIEPSDVVLLHTLTGHGLMAWADSASTWEVRDRTQYIYIGQACLFKKRWMG